MSVDNVFDEEEEKDEEGTDSEEETDPEDEEINDDEHAGDTVESDQDPELVSNDEPHEVPPRAEEASLSQSQHTDLSEGQPHPASSTGSSPPPTTDPHVPPQAPPPPPPPSQHAPPPPAPQVPQPGTILAGLFLSHSSAATSAKRRTTPCTERQRTSSSCGR